MITLKLTLDLRRKKKDGTYPIVFRITNHGVSRDIKTGFFARENEWNFKTQALRESHSDHTIASERLQELRVNYLDKLIQIQKSKNIFSAQQAKEFLLTEWRSQKNVTVYSLWEAEIALLKKANRIGGAQVYKEALIALDKVKSLKIPFERLDFIFLKELEAEFLSKGVKLNTLGIHLRALRAIYNKAINSKLVSLEYYPFRHYKIKREKTRPRTISCDDMRRYFNFQIDKSSYLYTSWLMGKLMFMLIGINFKDMVMLTESNLKADRIFYNRAKTNKLYSIKLLPEAKEILEHFRSEKNSTLLGRLSKTELMNKEGLTLLIRQKNKVFNAHLKKIGRILGYEEKLTGYVFRYTWANMAKQMGYSKDLIAEALGHEYGNKVTGIYLEGYDLELVDEMNSKILRCVLQNIDF